MLDASVAGTERLGSGRLRKMLPGVLILSERSLVPSMSARTSGRSQGVDATLLRLMVEEVAVGRRSYQWLTSETIDQIWVRLRAGKAAKPTARELGLSAGT